MHLVFDLEIWNLGQHDRNQHKFHFVAETLRFLPFSDDFLHKQPLNPFNFYLQF